MEPTWVNLTSGKPIAADFTTTSGRGTPIGIDSQTALAYFLGRRNTVQQLFAFITPQAFGAAADGITDDTVAIQAASDYINAQGGGVLYFPKGTYKVTAYIVIYPKMFIRGDGPLASVITSAALGGGGANAHENLRNGSIFHSVQAINSSIAVNISIENIGLTNTNGANVGAGYYDRGGTFITLKQVRVVGFKYSATFDQSELVDIDLCDFEAPLTGCIWLVNGADLSAGAAGNFTNRISINRTQFNGSTTVYGIIDDGGNAHSFNDNNHNGCLNHIRAAGVTGLKLSGGELESATGPSIRFENTSLAGAGVGACGSVYIGDGIEIVPGGVGQYCILAQSLGSITLNTAFLGNTTAAKFGGTGNVNAIYAMNCFNGGGGATFDGRATNHFEVGHDGTNFNVRTNMPIQFNGLQVLGARGAAVADAVNAAAAPTQAEFNAFVAQFNALLTRLRPAGHGIIA